MIKEFSCPITTWLSYWNQGHEQASIYSRIIIPITSSSTGAKCTVGAKCSCAKHTKGTFKSWELVLDLLSIFKGLKTGTSETIFW